MAAAVAEMRREASTPKESAHPDEVGGRLLALDKLCDSVIREFRRIAREKRNESDRIGLTCVLYRFHDALADLAQQRGLG